MTRNQSGILYGIAFIAFGLVMAALHWLMTGINDDFGMGVAVGIAIGMGVLAIASRSARESD